MAEEKELELDAKEIDADIDEREDEAEKNVPSKAEQKVELDLDDAPFLEEEVEEEKEEEKKESEPQEEKDEEEVKEEQKTEDLKSKKKKLILLGAAVGILVVAGLIAFLFLKGEKKEPPKEEKKVPEKKVEVKEKPPPPKPKMIQLTLRPFWVDYPVKNGHRYLHLVLILSYEESRLNWELLRKRIVIRDALYYYLKNKKIDFFLKKENIPVLKKDILSIINQYLVYGKIKEIYLKDYLIE